MKTKMNSTEPQKGAVTESRSGQLRSSPRGQAETKSKRTRILIVEDEPRWSPASATTLSLKATT